MWESLRWFIDLESKEEGEEAWHKEALKSAVREGYARLLMPAGEEYGFFSGRLPEAMLGY